MLFDILGNQIVDRFSGDYGGGNSFDGLSFINNRNLHNRFCFGYLFLAVGRFLGLLRFLLWFLWLLDFLRNRCLADLFGGDCGGGYSCDGLSFIDNWNLNNRFWFGYHFDNSNLLLRLWNGFIFIREVHGLIQNIHPRAGRIVNRQTGVGWFLGLLRFLLWFLGLFDFLRNRNLTDLFGGDCGGGYSCDGLSFIDNWNLNNRFWFGYHFNNSNLLLRLWNGFIFIREVHGFIQNIHPRAGGIVNRQTGVGWFLGLLRFLLWFLGLFDFLRNRNLADLFGGDCGGGYSCDGLSFIDNWNLNNRFWFGYLFNNSNLFLRLWDGFIFIREVHGFIQNIHPRAGRIVNRQTGVGWFLGLLRFLLWFLGLFDFLRNRCLADLFGGDCGGGYSCDGLSFIDNWNLNNRFWFGYHFDNSNLLLRLWNGFIFIREVHGLIQNIHPRAGRIVNRQTGVGWFLGLLRFLLWFLGLFDFLRNRNLTDLFGGDCGGGYSCDGLSFIDNWNLNNRFWFGYHFDNSNLLLRLWNGFIFIREVHGFIQNIHPRAGGIVNRQTGVGWFLGLLRFLLRFLGLFNFFRNRNLADLFGGDSCDGLSFIDNWNLNNRFWFGYLFNNSNLFLRLWDGFIFIREVHGFIQNIHPRAGRIVNRQTGVGWFLGLLRFLLRFLGLFDFLRNRNLADLFGGDCGGGYSCNDLSFIDHRHLINWFCFQYIFDNSNLFLRLWDGFIFIREVHGFIQNIHPRAGGIVHRQTGIGLFLGLLRFLLRFLGLFDFLRNRNLADLFGGDCSGGYSRDGFSFIDNRYANNYRLFFIWFLRNVIAGGFIIYA
ncbi:uncharacterized protein Dana_GF27385, isoform D [Drosophila ananassae]|uniref:Uncharacterized protein, isoform D n=1 Tax=Drosophila ananassae TaxID=7217 RepID=A0A0P9BP77_DROAN|nr:uncharacterized protein Dana_GF27385, isoform D [Drosophila ananassae]